MSKIENLIDIARLNELLGKKEEEKECRKVLWVLEIGTASCRERV